MKNCLALLFLLFTCVTQAQQQKTSQDSMHVFYDKFFSTIKKHYLYKSEVNWQEIEEKVNSNLPQYADFQSSLNEVKTIFEFAKADHSSVRFKKTKIAGNFPVMSRKDFSEQWQKKFALKPDFEVRVLNGEIGYILMPAIISEDLSSNNIHNISQKMYDEISRFKNIKNLKGWIIDLRLNTGGNCQPMILALYDFLGDTDVWGVLGSDKKQKSSVKLLAGTYVENEKKVSYITPTGVLLDQTKVAVIINGATGSSGEVTALAFKGRKNTQFIGEKTNGKTTSNVFLNLPFDTKMILTIGLDCDRNGNYYERIDPDIVISKKDNFDDLLSDDNILQAIKFIKQ